VRSVLDLSVVVPTHDRADSLRRLLDALSLQTLSADSFEVVVAVDGSRDGTLELLDASSRAYSLSSIWQEQAGRAAACNTAIRQASAPIVVILDDDMEPAAECLEAHLQAHACGTRRCVIGPVPIELSPADAPIARYFQEKFEAHLERLAEPDHRFVARDFYSGNASLERRLLEEVGLFDETFARYGNEDVELALRLRAADADVVYEPRALARQRFDKDLRRAIADAEAKGQTALLVVRRHPEAVSELRIASYDQAGPRWRFLRRVLLVVGRRTRLLPQLLTRLTLLLEWSGVKLPWRYYDLLLDFFFWLGVERPVDDLVSDDEAAPARLLLH
jgi:GT2 family glycosyltransferase